VPKPKLYLVGTQQVHNSSLPILPSIQRELDIIQKLALDQNVTVEATHFASQTATRASLREAHWAHIACHGIQHPTKPLESSFCLADGHLSVSELMKLDLKDAVFAFLSACETAKGDAAQPDQVIHLAAAMLFVGFKSVAATMW
jgi:CHAT domain-containing protein